MKWPGWPVLKRCSSTIRQTAGGQVSKQMLTHSDHTLRSPERQLCCRQPSDLRGAHVPQAKLRPDSVSALVVSHMPPFTGQWEAAVSLCTSRCAHLCCSKAGILLR